MRGATGITLQPHQILRLPRRIAFQNLREICRKRLTSHLQWRAVPRRSSYWKLQHFALRRSTQISPKTAPATKSDTATSPNSAPATKSDRTVKYLTEVLLDWTVTLLDSTVTLLNCYLTELLLYWTVSWLKCYFTELLPFFPQCNTSKMNPYPHNWRLRRLPCLWQICCQLCLKIKWFMVPFFPHFTHRQPLELQHCIWWEGCWAVTWLNCCLTELLLYWTVAWLSCYFSGLFAFLNLRNSQVSQLNFLWSSPNIPLLAKRWQIVRIIPTSNACHGTHQSAARHHHLERNLQLQAPQGCFH